MSSNLRSRMGRVGVIAAFALLAAGTITAAPALAAEGEGCPNEHVRHESNVNPTTGQPYSMGLPECRSYEMVSPPEKGGSSVSSNTGAPGFPAAGDGDAVGFTSGVAFGDAENAIISGLGTTENGYIARRTASGWETSSTLAPARLIGNVSAFHGLDGDATPNLSQVAACGTQIATNILSGVNAVCALREPDGSWLATPVFPSTTGSLYHEGHPGPGETIEYEGSSSDLSDVVFESSGPASEGATFLPADTSGEEGDGLYEVAGLGGASPQLRLVNVDDSGNEIGPDEGTRIGGIGELHIKVEPGGPQSCEGISGSETSSSYQAISADGQTIYFTACPSNKVGGVNEIYARVDGTSTVAISSPSPSQCTTCNTTPASAAFEGASADGSKAFFLTTQQLVNADTDSTMDLYEYDFDKPAGENLVQLSAGGTGDPTPGSGAEVQGVVRTSSDGSHVYFVAKGVLTTVPNGVGEAAQLGADNLYGVDTETAETKFVGDLCSNKEESGSVKPDSACPATLTGTIAGEGTNDHLLWGIDRERDAQATPSGRYLIFTTYARLIASGPEADTNEAQQVYRYDFETGKLNRISIGEPSFPASHNGNTPGMNATITPLPAGGGGGASGAMADINDYDRSISVDGSTIVFSTPEALQANDTDTGSKPSCASTVNGLPGATGCDVYEWHECASGTCEDGMSGEVNMITPGDDPASLDTILGRASMSASGSDIFFFTSTPLVGQDSDQLTDVYDARIDGGFPAPAPETSSCSGEACQGSPSRPPSFGSSGTSSYTGVGNLTPPAISVLGAKEAKPKTKPLTRTQRLTKALRSCKKDKSKAKRKSCEKTARKKYVVNTNAKGKKHAGGKKHG